MKKLLSLSLAGLMVMSLGASAWAAPTQTGAKTLKIVSHEFEAGASDESVAGISEYGYLEDDDNVVQLDLGEDPVPAGDTIYYPLVSKSGGYVTASDSVKSVKPSAKYTLGQNAVGAASIEYKKYEEADGTTGYAYMLAVPTKAHSSSSAIDFSADYTIKKTSGDDKAGDTYKFNMVVNTSFAIGFAKTKDTVKKDPLVLDVKDEDGEITLTMEEADDVSFDVDITGQSNVTVAFDTAYNSAIASKYPSANLEFYNGNGATFNKTGTLTIPAEPGEFIYLVNSDNSLSKVNNATYDDGEEAYKITTRTLGKYVVSDIELDISASGDASTSPSPTEPTPSEPSVPAPSDNTGKDNPGTGARA